MTRILFLPVLLISFGATAFSEIPTAAVWPPVEVPKDANPATVAAPRVDWVIRVQKTLEATKGKQFDLVFDGDSITDAWVSRGRSVWMERYAPLNAVDFGISGDKVESLLWRLQQGQVDGLDPKLVVLMIGTNNTGRDSADQIAEGISVVTKEYLKRCPNAQILLLGVFPRGANASDPIRIKIGEINKKIEALQGDRVTYLDISSKFLQPDGTLTKEIMPDFLHPSEKGYEIWADAIQQVVDKYVPKAAAN